MNTYLYENLSIGMTEKFSVQITESMIKAFRNITGDINPLHTDERFAKRNNYPDKVVYGMLTASFLSTLAGCYLPGEKSLIQSVETKFVKPVYCGDVLTVIGSVSELHDTVKQIVLRVEIYNQNQEKVLRGKMKIGVLQAGKDDIEK